MDQMFVVILAEHGDSEAIAFKNSLQQQGLDAAVSEDGLAHFIALPDREKYIGVITVEFSKRYSIGEVMKIADAVRADSSKIYLGSQPSPELGRKTLSLLFWFIHSKRIQDIQTGLRGFPNDIVGLLAEYDHPLHVLVEMVRLKKPIEEVPLDSQSLKASRSSGRDMIVLFGTFMKYILSSFASFIVDISLFQLVIFFMGAFDSDVRIWTATVISRICSSVVNFLINKNVVFQNTGGNKRPAIKYFALVIGEMLASASLVAILYRFIRIPETIIKVLVDLLLFFTGYIIEKVFIFDRE